VLAQPGLSAAALGEATADIEEEVTRLNRIVNEVLDFARPIRFTLGPTDLNALCRDSAAASEKSAAGAAVGLSLDPSLTLVTTDGERLRIALINLLVNARHAVNGAQAGRTASDPTAPPVTLRTERIGACAAITIADRGVGISPADLPRVFDPYFTTKRGGTGLGLAIAKNIVEGLGGTIAVSSVAGRGTDIRIELSTNGAPS
jgi:signal transduction histidine kinase